MKIRLPLKLKDNRVDRHDLWLELDSHCFIDFWRVQHVDRQQAACCIIAYAVLCFLYLRPTLDVVILLYTLERVEHQ